MAALAGATYAGSQDGEAKGPDASVAPGVETAAIAPGLQPEASFVRITPCRAIDTRVGANTPLAPNAQRGFDVFGSNLSAQGGSASGCGIPTYAVAVEVNATAVDPTGTGFLRADAQPTRVTGSTTPAGALPSATLLNYSSALNATNGTTVPTCNFARGGVGFSLLVECIGQKEIRFQAFTRSTDLVVDLVGYYVVPVSGTFDGDVLAGTDPLVIRSFGVTAVDHPFDGRFVITVNRDLRGCNVVAGTGNSNDEPGSAVVTTVVSLVNASTISISQRISSTQAPENDDFTFVAHC